jgi:hypothetical protein
MVALVPERRLVPLLIGSCLNGNMDASQVSVLERGMGDVYGEW